MVKLITKSIAIILCLIMPIFIFIGYVERIDDQFDKTYMAALNDKYELLKNQTNKKILFVGGSSLPFGIRSDLVEREFNGEYSVINLGLYATLGTKFMMDMADDFVGKGDIVVLSPELSAQTYSLYFNADAVLESTDGFSEIRKAIPLGDRLNLFYNYYKYASKKISYSKSGNAPNPIGIYRRDSFNNYGDIEVFREFNVMNGMYDINTSVSFTQTLLNEEFLDYVNKFNTKVNKCGATLYFNYSPVNVLAVSSSKAQGVEFNRQLSEALDCDILNDIDSAIMHEGYFYDTNYHLNSSGAIFYTAQVVKNIKRLRGVAIESSIVVPPPPATKQDLPVEEPVDDSIVEFERYDGGANLNYVDYFEFRLIGNTYHIVGVKESALSLEEMILPSSYQGKAVTTIREDAFNGCERLKRIRIGRTYKVIERDAFNSLSSLEGIYLYELDGNVISVPNDGLLNGCNKNVKIFILNEAQYTTGYTWINYVEYFKYFSIKTGTIE